MSMTDPVAPVRQQPRLGDLLVRSGLINAAQLEGALEAQHSRRRRLGEILREDGLLDDVSLSAALSFQLDAPLVDLRSRLSSDEALSHLAEPDARRMTVLPLAFTDGALEVAVDDPGDASLLSELATLTGVPVLPRLAPRSEIETAIRQRYRMTEVLAQQVDAFARARPTPAASVRVAQDALRDAPVVQIVNLLVAQALRDRASDLHLEPRPDALHVRARIDGILHEVTDLPLDIAPSLASRIKILSELNIVEKQRAQDGKITMDVEGRLIDIRVATMRTIWGEKIVLRLLDKSRNVLRLDELGFPAAILPTFRDLLKSNFGMVIVCGPTGSGKTTTLYASLHELDRAALNVATIEDPVEYTLADVNQTQVNAAAGIDFAAGLRAILRQDPDVILVGEVRDRETAQIAVQAALTGHLVLSSMHATDAPSALFRLLEMGVEPFLVAASVTGIVAQRLVRRVCPHCRVELEPTAGERALYETERIEGARAWIGRGCTYCSGTGFLDRLGAFELLRVSPALRRLVSDAADYDQIRAQAMADGMRPLRSDALLKAAAGLTTAAEAIRSVSG
jgi:type IV pilus assembly protein PilB